MKRIILALAFFLAACSYVSATHQRAAEITYRHVDGLTYEVKVITYTYTPSPADRPTLDVFWGDGTASTLSYAILSQAFPPTLAGRVNTAFNLLVLVAAFLMQWGLGAMIGLWPRTAAGGYAPAGYSAGFGLVVALQVAAMGWFWCAGAGSNRRIRLSRQLRDSTV